MAIYFAALISRELQQYSQNPLWTGVLIKPNLEKWRHKGTEKSWKWWSLSEISVWDLHILLFYTLNMMFKWFTAQM